MSKIEFSNGVVILSFDTWEEFDSAIPAIAGVYQPESDCN